MEQTNRDYERAIAGLSLVDLYREEDRLEREVDRWSRIPGGESQVLIRKQRLAMLSNVIAQQYAQLRGTFTGVEGFKTPNQSGIPKVEAQIMAKQMSSSSVLAGIASKVAGIHEQAKKRPVQHDTTGRLPPGIDNGVAQLYEIVFGAYKEGENKGQYYFRASGVVKAAPGFAQEDLVKGLQTRIGPEPLCDTPKSQGKRKTVQDHWNWMMDQLNLFDDKLFRESTPDNLEVLCRQLVAAKPHFRFRTWRGQKTAAFPNPRTNEVWDGITQYDPDAQPPGASNNTQDDSPQANGQAGFDEYNDLDSLVKKASGKNAAEAAKAKEILKNMALGAGHSEEAIEEAKDWAEVAAMTVTNPAASAEEETSEEESSDSEESATEEESTEEVVEESSIPTVSSIRGFCPLDKNKKRTKKPVDCEITAVDKENETVTLVNLGNRKVVYKGVKWNLLQDAN